MLNSNISQSMISFFFRSFFSCLGVNYFEIIWLYLHLIFSWIMRNIWTWLDVLFGMSRFFLNYFLLCHTLFRHTNGAIKYGWSRSENVWRENVLILNLPHMKLNAPTTRRMLKQINMYSESICTYRLIHSLVARNK